MKSVRLSDLANPLSPHKVDFAKLNYFQDSTLRDYQVENKRKIYQAWETHRSVMLQMPTGTGKTRLFVSIVRDLHNWGALRKQAVKVLILAHRKELIEQIDETLGLKYHLVHGIIMSQNMEHHKYPVQVGSVPTLNRRLERWGSKDFDVIIIDEAHHVKARSYKEILRQFPNAKILGVTATPYRLNGAGFHPEFEELIISDPVSLFIKRGYLSDYQYYSISMNSGLQAEIDTMKIDKLDGDYLDSEMMNVMDRSEIRARIVNTYIKYAKGKKGIVYTVNKQHNHNIKEQFVAAGVKAEVVTNDTPKEERAAIVNKFRNGELDVLCNVNIFSEGFDCPDIEFVQLARPTRSLAMYLQQVGRGLRPAEGKSRAIILDNVGLYNKFGFPSARRKWRYHFEGKEVQEIEPVRLENDLDEGNREVIPIEEGNESVLLLHDSKDEYDNLNETESMTNTQSQLEIKLAILLANIEGLKTMGIPVPNDWLKQVEMYQASLHPEREIEQKIKKVIEQCNEYSIDFEYHSQEKPSFNAEINALKEKSLNAKNSINAIDKIIENVRQLGGLSIPSELEERKATFTNTIDESDGHILFLEEISNVLQQAGAQLPLHILYRKGKLRVSCIDKELHETSENNSKTRRTSNMTKIRVTLPNGKVLSNNVVADTFVAFIKYAGVDRVRSLNLTCRNLPLITKGIVDGMGQKSLGNGLYLITHSSTDQKRRTMEKIADLLKLDVRIEA